MGSEWEVSGKLVERPRGLRSIGVGVRKKAGEALRAQVTDIRGEVHTAAQGLWRRLPSAFRAATTRINKTSTRLKNIN